RVRRDLGAVAPGVQLIGRFKEVVQQPLDRRQLADLLSGEAVDFLFGVGQVGVDFPILNIRDDKQRRVVELLAVLHRLLVGGAQLRVFAYSFVFNSDVAFIIDIGKALAAAVLLYTVLKDEAVAPGIGAAAARWLVADHLAQGDKMRLIALPFVEGGVG